MHSRRLDFVDAKGKVQDTLRTALKDITLTLPEEFSEQEDGIKDILRKLAGKLDIKSADERITIRTRDAVLESEGFKELWDRIKHKTTYSVEFDNAKLIEDCARAITDGSSNTKTRAQFRVADILIGKSGVQASETSALGFTSISESDIKLPDLLTDLQDKTQLTRKSLIKILTDSRRRRISRRTRRNSSIWRPRLSTVQSVSLWSMASSTNVSATITITLSKSSSGKS